MAGLLKLSKENLKFVPEVHADIPEILIMRGESVPIPLVKPRHLGACAFPLIEGNAGDK